MTEIDKDATASTINELTKDEERRLINNIKRDLNALLTKYADKPAYIFLAIFGEVLAAAVHTTSLGEENQQEYIDGAINTMAAQIRAYADKVGMEGTD